MTSAARYARFTDSKYNNNNVNITIISSNLTSTVTARLSTILRMNLTNLTKPSSSSSPPTTPHLLSQLTTSSISSRSSTHLEQLDDEDFIQRVVKKPSWIEWLLIYWMFAFAAEEARQVKLHINYS